MPKTTFKNPKTCACPHCGRMFTYQTACDKHAAGCKTQHQCKFCHRNFFRKAHLQSHVQTVHSKKTFQVLGNHMLYISNTLGQSIPFAPFQEPPIVGNTYVLAPNGILVSAPQTLAP